MLSTYTSCTAPPSNSVPSAADESIFDEFLPTVTVAAPTFLMVTVLPALGELGNVMVNAVDAWLHISWSLVDAV